MYDFIDWLITYGHPIISILRTVKFNNYEIQDCYDYSIFSLEKAIETKDKNIVCANLVDSLYEFNKILKRYTDNTKEIINDSRPDGCRFRLGLGGRKPIR